MGVQGRKRTSGKNAGYAKVRQQKRVVTCGKHRENALALPVVVSDRVVVENNFLSVADKTELELAKQTLQTSKDPAEREQAQQTINALREKDIASDKKVIDACGNGNAASAGCASARLEVIAAKGEYETGQYNNKISDMYAGSYGQILNLLNITSVDAQNQQQVKDAMVNYAMAQLGVDRATAQNYVETYDGMKTVAASMTPVLGAAAVSKLSTLAEKVVVYPSGINFKIDQPKHLATVDGFTQKNGISGGHNANAFYEAAKEYNVKVVSETPTGVKGITEVKYLVPTKNRDGSLTGEYKTTVETKTIYDPKVFTDQKILELGQQAAARGFNEAMSSKSGQTNVTVDDVSFRIYVDKTTGTVRNFHPN